MSVHKTELATRSKRGCYRKLCREEATHAVDVRDMREALVFNVAPHEPRRAPRHYELCDAHFDDYFKGGVPGWLAREDAVRLRVQCRHEPVPEEATR